MKAPTSSTKKDKPRIVIEFFDNERDAMEAFNRHTQALKEDFARRNPFKCDGCNGRFKSISARSEHKCEDSPFFKMKKEHPFKCDGCNRRFKSISARSEHKCEDSPFFKMMKKQNVTKK